MTKTLLCAVAATLLAATGTARAQDAIDAVESPNTNPWTSLDVNAGPDQFQFVIVTDRTGGHRPGVFEDGVRKINLLQPEFVMSVGDLIEGYTENLDEIDRQWKEFNGFVDKLEMPFFYVPGNHDISNLVMVEEWEKRFGRLYFHFVYKDVLFLCLDTEDPPSSQMSDAQIAYAAKALEDNPDVRWTLVFMHKPLWTYGDPTQNGFSKLEEHLKGRAHSIFAGHTHHYYKHERNDSEYIVLATMGGGSALRGPNFGEFDHFMWVTMMDDGPRIANLMLDGIWDTNVLNDERMGLLRPVMSGAAVTTDGIVIDGPLFDTAKTTLRLTNDADVPMAVTLAVHQTKQVSSDVLRVEETIAPNSVKTVPMTLTAKPPLRPADVEPLVLSWNVHYEVEDDVQPLRLRGRHRIVVDTAFALTAVPGAITVDGALSEWTSFGIDGSRPGSVASDSDAWYGPRDSAAEFSVSYDSKNLYVAVNVQDDHVSANERRGYQRTDAIAIHVDARPEGDRVGDGAWRVATIAGKNPGDVGERGRLPEIPEGVTLASQPADGGYGAELAIPLDMIEAAGGADWSSVRVNVVVYDTDPDGQATVAWRPVWTTPADYAHSGTFRKP